MSLQINIHPALNGESFESLAAAYDDATSRFSWYEYQGKPFQIASRKHRREVNAGAVYGVRQVKGGHYYLILPEMYHVDFPVDKALGDRVISNSTKTQQPEIERYEGTRAPKAAGLRMLQRVLANTQFDAPRFKVKGVTVENKAGINFSNYQWRVLNTLRVKLRHTKGYEDFISGDQFGVRFVKPALGGFLVNKDGLYLKLSAEDFDELVANSLVMPVGEWPSGSVSVEQMQEYVDNRQAREKRTISEQREATRMRERAERLAAQQEQQQRKKEAEEKRQADRKRLAELGRLVRDPKERIVVSEMKPMSAEEYRTMKASVSPEFDSLVDGDLLGSDYSEKTHDFEHVNVQKDNAAVVADNVGIMDTLDTALNLDDDADDVDMSDVDLDEEEDSEDIGDADDLTPKVKAKMPKVKRVVDDKKTDEKDPEEGDEEDDFEDDEEEDDLEEEDDFEDDEEDLDEGDEEDLDEGDEGDEEDLDESEGDEEDSIGDEDLDQDAEADELVDSDDPIDSPDPEDTEETPDAKTRTSAKEA